jgi:hypothetical protein
MKIDLIKNRLNAITGHRFRSVNHLQDLIKGLLNETDLCLHPVNKFTHSAIDHELKGTIFKSGEPKTQFSIFFIHDNGFSLYITEVNIT